MGRVGWRPYVSPISTLLTNVVASWNAETSGTGLDTSIYASWNGEANANDSVGTKHGTLINGTTITAGKIGNAFTYNAATSDYVDLPQMAFKFTGSFTVSMWVYNTSGSGTDRTLCHNYPFQAGSGQRGWKFGINTANQIYFIRTYNQFINGSNDLSNALVTVPLNTWTHVGMSWNASTRQISFIQNGEFVRSVTLSQWDIYYPTPDSLNVARIGHPTFKGKIDAFNIWTKVLTNDEALNLHNAGNGAQYPFSSQSLPSTNDAVGTSHGTLVNGATFSTGKIGNAFSFDGINDSIDIGNKFDLGTKSWTFNVWFNANTIKDQYIFSKGQSTWESFRYGLNVKADGKLCMFIGDWMPGSMAPTSTQTITAGQWYMATVVIDRSYGVGAQGNQYQFILKLYINGIRETLIGAASFTNSSSITPYDNYANFRIGAFNDASNNGLVSNFNGTIDLLSIWDRPLTQSEITQLYNSGNGKQYPF